MGEDLASCVRGWEMLSNTYYNIRCDYDVIVRNELKFEKFNEKYQTR